MQEKITASYLRNAIAIINAYNGDEPFNIFLKKYFTANKKFGSKDRKHISHFCYCYFRLGNVAKNISTEEKIKISLFLCNDNAGIYASLFSDEWINSWHESIETKIDFIRRKYAPFNIENIFFWNDELSENINTKDFSLSHLVQPDLFIRIRPGKNENVLNKLKANNISFKQLNDDCLAFENATKLDDIISINKDAVIQDYSSQRIKEFLLLSSVSSHLSTTVWDCCAASGGKSILAYDTIKNISLAVSDIRHSIIQNLKKRFSEAGIKNYDAFIKDLSAKSEMINQKQETRNQKLIICDAPCTGSGTWSRTPEQLSFFTKDKIAYYQNLQKKIVSNTIPHLYAEGYFLYITCSVFKKENEDVADYIKENFHLTLIKMEVLKGYNLKAGTMFAALFQKQ